MRYFLKLSYRGACYHGWQSQPNAITVQQTIEDALTTILRCPVPIVGAGRTDTGVNARVMFAHFDTPQPIADFNKFLIALNRLCGPEIAIDDVLPVCDDAHARFDAIARTYKYFITFSKSPFLAPLSWNSMRTLDVDAMNRCGEILLHTSDFTSFAKLHSDAKTNICKVSEAYWQTWNDDFKTPGIVFTITADRFLRNMVRAVVGTMVDVGRNKISVDDFQSIINKKNRCAAGTSMPPQALFLWDIIYPNSIYKS